MTNNSFHRGLPRTSSGPRRATPSPLVRDEAGSPRVVEAVRRLRAAGERLTPGRRAVLQVLDAESTSTHRHLDAESIAAAVARIEPGVHRATIYRSLQALVDLGLVAHTHVPGGATIYHLALHAHTDGEGTDEPEFHAHGHAHLQCARCDRFVDVSSDEFAGLAERVRELTGFEIDAEHAALLGTCQDCQLGKQER